MRDPEERTRIRQIEEEELHHRRQVGGMLRELGEAPRRWLEIKATMIGRTLGALCHVAGWFAPMYGAGKLESRNIREYEAAARHARGCGREDLVDCLLTMAEVEWDHERYFRDKVLGHGRARRVRIWPEPPAKRTIRAAFEPAATTAVPPEVVAAP